MTNPTETDLRNIDALNHSVGRCLAKRRATVGDNILGFVPGNVQGDASLREADRAFGVRVQWFSLEPKITREQRRTFGFFSGANLNGLIYLRSSGVDRPALYGELFDVWLDAAPGEDPMPMTLTQAKQTIRKIRAELSMISNEGLKNRIHLNPLYKDGQTEEFWELLRLRRYVESRLLNSRLGRKRRSSIERAADARTMPVF